MPKDPRVDAYIAKSAAFARPILNHFRRLVHAACPEIEETMKWSFPNFLHHGIVCNMAAFKAHCAFGFWKGRLLFKDSPHAGAMGHLGRITSLSELPGDAELIGYIKQAIKLNESGVKQPPRNLPKKKLRVPPWFRSALNKNKKALATFDNFSYSHKKEYLEWLIEAKTEETRARRLATTLQWLAEGKSRNWKYKNC